MERRGETLELSDGSRVAFDEYGVSDGQPVLFCHGWPSSRSMAKLAHAAAEELGVRIISPDRPGICRSTFRPDRRLADWPAFLGELMNRVGIPEFRILAISGGAPYAYASAIALPERVKALSVVSGVPPIAELEDHADLLRLYRMMLKLYARHPRWLRWFFHLARPIARVRPSVRVRPLLLKALQPCDAAVLRDSESFEACFESARRAWDGSAAGVMADAEIYARPWEIRPEEISVPVQIWHGTRDRTFSFRYSEAMAARIPHSRLHLVEGAGHYSLPIRYIRDILSELVQPENVPMQASETH